MAKEKTVTEKYIAEVNAVRGVFMSTLTIALQNETMKHMKSGMNENELAIAKAVSDAMQNVNKEMRSHFPVLVAGEDY